MEIQFREARTALEKLEVYALRKKVFIDEEERFPYSLDHIVDQYDSLDDTINFIAIAEDKIIASIRLIMDGPAGLPVDQYKEITDFKKNLTGSCITLGWMCCIKDYRHKSGLIKSLFRPALLHARKKGFEHMLAVIHPPAFDLLHHSFGVEKIGAMFRDKERNLEMMPIYADVATMINQSSATVSKEHRSMALVDQPGFHGRYHFLEQALSRNIGIFSLAEQDRLMECKIAIPGLGGVGGQHLVTLARTGITNFHIADFDRFEPANFNRQYGARTSGFDRPKIDVMYEEAMDINPYLKIKCFDKGVSQENIDEFLEGVDLVADGMDFFNFDIRRLIFKKAYEKGIPVITAGPLGFSTAMLIFMPDQGMTFDNYFNITNKLNKEEKLIKFFIGLAPKATQKQYIPPNAINMRTRKGPSLGAACLLCSSLVATETARILLGKKGVKPVPHYFQYDLFTRKFYQGCLYKGNRHPLQRFKAMIIKKRLEMDTLTDIRPVVPMAVKGKGTITQEIMNYLVTAGSRAPSGDNCQPWRFEYDKHQLEIFLDPLADDSFFNVNQTASHIACGAAVENILIAASRFKLSAQIEYFPAGDRPELVAKMSFASDNTREDPLQRFIWERHTNRTKFNKKPIGEDKLAEIRKSTAPFDKAELVLVTDRQDINKIADIIYEADKIRSERRDLHEHLIKMIRFTNRDALDKRDGFPIKNLETGPGGELFLNICRPWAFMHLMNKIGMGKMISSLARTGIKQSSALGLLKIRGKSCKDLIIGGQALEKVWLTCTRLGISFQPMTAITLFRQRCKLGMENDFSLNHQQLLGKIEPVYEQLFHTKNDETEIMLFRLGFGKTISCRTLRKEHIS